MHSTITTHLRERKTLCKIVSGRFGRSREICGVREGARNLPVWQSIVASKILLATAVLLGLCSEFDIQQFSFAFARWPPTGDRTFGSRLAAWDSAHYLVLATKGYEPGSPSCAFYPLWPAAIRAASWIFINPLIAAMILGNAMSVLSFWMFYKLVERDFGNRVAGDSLVLLLAFPGAVFFSFPYTESLYFIMVMVFFWGLARERYFWVCITSFLMPLTKAIGVFAVVPLAWHLHDRKRGLGYWLLVLAPLLGYASYFALMYAWTGNALDGFEAQKAYPYSPSVLNILNVGGFVRTFLHIGSVDGMTDSALDRLFFIFLALLLPWIYRRNRAWFLYSLAAGLIPAGTSWFMSYRRYIMVCFPVFIVLAQLLAKTKQRWIFWYYVAWLAALQVWAVKELVNFGWAG